MGDANREPSRPQAARGGWLVHARKVLDSLLSLPVDWNGAHAALIDPAVVRSVERMLTGCLPAGVPEPNILPLPNGGVGIEWHAAGIDLEIATREPDRFDVLFTDHQTGGQWDAEDVPATDPELQARLSLLAARGKRRLPV